MCVYWNLITLEKRLKHFWIKFLFSFSLTFCKRYDFLSWIHIHRTGCLFLQICICDRTWIKGWVKRNKSCSMIKKNMSTYCDFFVFNVFKTFLNWCYKYSIVWYSQRSCTLSFSYLWWYLTTIENKERRCGGHVILYVKRFRFYKMY